MEMWHRGGQHGSDLQSACGERKKERKNERAKKRVGRCSFAASPAGVKFNAVKEKKF